MGALTLTEGFTGTGKNLFIVRALLLNPYWDIYSTFELFGQLKSRYHVLTPRNLLSVPEKSFIVNDEGWDFWDNRESSRAINKLGSYVKNELRKANVQIYIAQPDTQELDIRFRRKSAWDHHVYCRRVPNGKIRWEEWDFEFIITSKHKSGQLTQRKEYISYENAKKYFHLWNTFERRKVVDFSRLEQTILSENNEDDAYWERVNEIIEQIRPHIVGRATLKAIDTVFNEYGITSRYLHDVWNIMNKKVKIPYFEKIRKSREGV